MMDSLKMNAQQAAADLQNIKTAIINAGVEVPDGTFSSNYAGKVGEVYQKTKEDFGLKAHANDTAVVVEDVNPVEHDVSVKLSSDTIADFSTVKLTRCGRNIFDCLNAERVQNGKWYVGVDEITERTESSLTVRKTNDKSYTYVQFALPEGLEGKTITIYAEWTCSGDNTGYIRVNWSSSLEAANIIVHSTQSGVAATGVVPPKKSDSQFLTLLLYGSKDVAGTAGSEVYYKNIQVVIGDETGEYEPYNGATYTPNADGTVEGVKSISPTMVLVTDTDDVVIDTECYQDGSIGASGYIEEAEQSTHSAWWNCMTQGGTQTNFEYMFQNYDFNLIGGFNPPYKFTPIYLGYTFRGARGITKITKEQFDFSQVDSMNWAFNNCYDLEEIEELYYVGTPNYPFHTARKLKTIGKFIIKEGATFGHVPFGACDALANISVEGTIPNDLSFQSCSNLTRDSILGKETTDEEIIAAGKNLISLNGVYYYGGIFGALSDTAESVTLTLHTTAVNNAFETSSGAADGSTSDEWTALVAAKPNWTIALL